MHVAVLGASPKAERFSNKAVRELRQHGHVVTPVNPAHGQIEGLSVAADLAAVPQPVDTLTVYVGPEHIGPLIPQILRLHPGRVIANPGAESQPLADALRQAGIPYIEACTLVLLATGRF